MQHRHYMLPAMAIKLPINRQPMKQEELRKQKKPPSKPRKRDTLQSFLEGLGPPAPYGS